MIIVVGGIKGGTGKTTIATNLAVIHAFHGCKTLLIDADEQRSSSDWAEQREEYFLKTSTPCRARFPTISLSGKNIYSQIQKLCEDYDDVVVDVGGRDTTSQRSVLTIADIFIVPFKPRSLDVWTMGHVKNLINEIKSVNHQLKSFVLVNQADVRGTDNDDAITILSELEEVECMKSCIRHRKAFANAASLGLSVVELEHQDEKATREIYDIYEKICT